MGAIYQQEVRVLIELSESDAGSNVARAMLRHMSKDETCKPSLSESKTPREWKKLWPQVAYSAFDLGPRTDESGDSPVGL
jgi:hypothetical protein